MGALAEAFGAYARPLLEQTDGSHEQVSKAFALCQLCYNLALLPEDKRETTLNRIRPTLQMDDEEFDEFRRTVVIPMIRRHEEMFPRLHRRVSTDPGQSGPSLWAQPETEAPAKAHPAIDRYAPCPCNSGEKYKFCCGAKRR